MFVCVGGRLYSLPCIDSRQWETGGWWSGRDGAAGYLQERVKLIDLRRDAGCSNNEGHVPLGPAVQGVQCDP
jgi:hypothetical protein